MAQIATDVKVQMASQDYDCAAYDCDVPIPEETQYVRVAATKDLGHRDADGEPRSTALLVEKFHPSCWERING